MSDCTQSLDPQLSALSEAARAITSELSLEQVLQKIAQVARHLINARFAALGVHDGQGHLSRFITAGVDPAIHPEIGALPAGRGLLGIFLHEGKSLIVNNIASHAAAFGFPPHHPTMRSLLGVPIFSKGKLIGALYLADKLDGFPFTETDQQLIETLALHAAIAIENARLYEKNQRLAVLEERERFACDLHDGIIQSLYAVGLSLDNAKAEIAESNQVAIAQIDLSLKSMANIIDDIRSYISGLRPHTLQDEGLRARLESLVAELRTSARLPIRANIDPQINAYLTEAQASHIFHIAHEAISNATRHAQANEIFLSLTHYEDTVTLQVEDDGVGFDLGLLGPQHTSAHRGLSNIQTRISLLDATLKIDTHLHRGTCLTVTLPCKQEALHARLH
jgi:signal transduction histidine kinase